MTAIEVVEKLIDNMEDDITNHIECGGSDHFQMRCEIIGANRALGILKEEAESPCPRCKHFNEKAMSHRCKKVEWEEPYCKHLPECPDLFEPREAGDE